MEWLLYETLVELFFNSQTKKNTFFFLNLKNINSINSLEECTYFPAQLGSPSVIPKVIIIMKKEARKKDSSLTV